MEVLHSLCNMLIVAPENLRQIVSEEAHLVSGSMWLLQDMDVSIRENRII